MINHYIKKKYNLVDITKEQLGMVNLEFISKIPSILTEFISMENKMGNGLLYISPKKYAKIIFNNDVDIEYEEVTSSHFPSDLTPFDMIYDKYKNTNFVDEDFPPTKSSI